MAKLGSKKVGEAQAEQPAAVDPTPQPAVRDARRIRHYQQRLAETKDFVWCRHGVTNGKPFAPGDRVDVAGMTPHKLRMLWNSRWIQAANFDLATARKARNAHRRRTG